MTVKTPWLSSYGAIPATLDYPDLSMVDLIEENAKDHAELLAYEFLGKKVTFRQFLGDIKQCAKSLVVHGIKEDDRVTICMPNTPQGVTMFYALNMIGAVPNMVHPLSAEGEIEFYLKHSRSVAILTLDAFYPKIARVQKNVPKLRYIMVASIADELSGITKLGFKLTKGRKIKKVPEKEEIITYPALMKKASDLVGPYRSKKKGDAAAAILYSGGTSGTTKGIVLTNLNFNALAMQTAAAGDCVYKGHKMLSVMPIFHGFGLGVCIHTMLVNGATCVLVPQFNVETYAKLLKKGAA